MLFIDKNNIYGKKCFKLNKICEVILGLLAEKNWSKHNKNLHDKFRGIYVLQRKVPLAKS